MPLLGKEYAQSTRIGAQAFLLWGIALYFFVPWMLPRVGKRSQYIFMVGGAGVMAYLSIVSAEKSSKAKPRAPTAATSSAELAGLFAGTQFKRA